MQIFIGNDNVVELDGVSDDITGDALDSANAQMTLVDLEDNPVDGQTWPTPLVSVGNGLYRGTLSFNLDLEHLNRYRVIVDIDAGPGRQARFEFNAKARTRSEVNEDD